MKLATGEGRFAHMVELIGEADEDNPRGFDKLPVANVPAIVRPISTGGTIIDAKLPNLRGGLVR